MLAAIVRAYHSMSADQWDVQETVKRIVNELQARGYTVWFDLYK